MSQFDIGFNTSMLKWFVQGYTDSRAMSSMNHINNSNIKLDKVMCDTYAWGGDQQNPDVTHGRLRYYSGPTQELKATGNLADSFKVTGDKTPFKFLKLHGKAVLNYNVSNMTWNIIIDGNTFTTKNIVGLITGETEKKHIRFDIEESTIYFNTFITLINPDFITPSKDQCNTFPNSK